MEALGRTRVGHGGLGVGDGGLGDVAGTVKHIVDSIEKVFWHTHEIGLEEQLNAYCHGPNSRLGEQVVGPEVEVVRDLNAYCNGPKAKTQRVLHETKLHKCESLIDNPQRQHNDDNQQQRQQSTTTTSR